MAGCYPDRPPYRGYIIHLQKKQIKKKLNYIVK